MTYAEHLTLTVVTIWLVLYAAVAFVQTWRQRPGVGYDAEQGRYRASRLMWRERRRDT